MTSFIEASYSEPRMVREGKWENVNAGTATSSSTMTSESGSSSSYRRTEVLTSLTETTVAHEITDDGVGGFVGGRGLVNYSGKTVALKVTADGSTNSYQADSENISAWSSINNVDVKNSSPEGGGVNGGGGQGGGNSSSTGGSHGSHSFKEVYGSAALLVSYKTGSPTPVSQSETFTPPGVVIDLCPTTKDRIVPGSVRFTWMGTVYEDFEGSIYRDRTESDPGIWSGDIDYYQGMAYMFDYVVSGSPTSFTLNSLWTSKGRWNSARIYGATATAPLRSGAFTFSVLDIAGDQIIATADNDGLITGTHCIGTIDYESGSFELLFGDYVLDDDLTDEQKAESWYNPADVDDDGEIWRPWPVDPVSFRYNAVAYFYLPLDADILGLDPVRLPQDGRVPIFRPGGFAVIGHTGSVTATVSNGQTLSAGRVRLSRARIIGDDGELIDAGYTFDLEAGTVTFTDVSGYSQPITFEHRIEDMVQVAEVQIDGNLSFTRALTHAYPVPGSYVSSALITGDLRARVNNMFDQATWNNTWSDIQSGAAATGTFNDVLNPIEVTNAGALTERWAVLFTNSTSFQVIGEHVGVIAIGNTSTDCSPLNPASGTPYFTIPAAGWGLGWSTGNLLRFNTVGAYFPVWVVRTIQQGPETDPDDSFVLLIRGDVDRP